MSHWGMRGVFGDSPSIVVSYFDAFAKAVEFNATGKVTWSIGADLTKNKYRPLRYQADIDTIDHLKVVV